MSQRLLILNPESGSVRDDPRLLTTLQAHPAMNGVELVLSDGSDDLRALARDAREEQREAVLVGGGDGTIHHVVNGLLDGLDPDSLPSPHSLPILGVLPMGTGNDLARSLGLARDAWKTLEAMDWTRHRTMDLICSEETRDVWAVNVISGGLASPEPAPDDDEKEWPGVLAYWRRGVEALSEEAPSYRITLEWDGGEERTVEAQNVVMGNGRTVAGGVPVTPEARLDDGLLDLLVVPHLDVAEMSVLFPRLLLGRHPEHEALLARRAREVKIRSEPELDLSVDGEPDRVAEARFRVVQGVIRVLVGPEAHEGAFGG